MKRPANLLNSCFFALVIFFSFISNTHSKSAHPSIGYIDRARVLYSFPGIQIRAARIVSRFDKRNIDLRAHVYSHLGKSKSNNGGELKTIKANYNDLSKYWDKEMTFIVKKIYRAEETIADKKGLSIIFNYGEKFNFQYRLQKIAKKMIPASMIGRKGGSEDRRFRFFDSPLGLGGREITDQVIQLLETEMRTPDRRQSKIRQKRKPKGNR